MAHLFIDDFPINTSIYKGFSMAMLHNQRVESEEYGHWPVLRRIPGPEQVRSESPGMIEDQGSVRKDGSKGKVSLWNSPIFWDHPILEGWNITWKDDQIISGSAGVCPPIPLFGNSAIFKHMTLW